MPIVKASVHRPVLIGVVLALSAPAFATTIVYVIGQEWAAVAFDTYQWYGDS